MKTISTISRRDLLKGLGSVGIVLATGRSAWPAIGTGPISFLDVAGAAGITFRHDNAASSEKTLGIMFVIACIGVPVVIAYTISIYWIFRGKVKLDRVSY